MSAKSVYRPLTPLYSNFQHTEHTTAVTSSSSIFPFMMMKIVVPHGVTSVIPADYVSTTDYGWTSEILMQLLICLCMWWISWLITVSMVTYLPLQDLCKLFEFQTTQIYFYLLFVYETKKEKCEDKSLWAVTGKAAN